MLLRKQDIDPRIAKRLPRTALHFKKRWSSVAAGAGMALAGIGLPLLLLAVPPPLTFLMLIGGVVASGLLITRIVLVVERSEARGAIVSAAGLRTAARYRELDPVEQQYCRAVATLSQSPALSEQAARELLADLNRLLAAHRTLIAQEPSKKARAAREEATTEALRQLRASLKRAGKVTASVTPVVVAQEAAAETLTRVRLQTRSLEQATEEVQRIGQ